MSWLFALHRINFCASMKIDHCQNIGPVAKLPYILILPWKQICRLSSLREGFFFKFFQKRGTKEKTYKGEGRPRLPTVSPTMSPPRLSTNLITIDYSRKKHGKEFCQRVIWKQSSLTSRCLWNNNDLYSLYLLVSSSLLFSDSMQVSLLVLISCFYLARP